MNIYQQPQTRAQWPPGRSNELSTESTKLKETNTMRNIEAKETNGKPKKRQADRLLKQLPMSERRRQQQIRQLIQSDPLFGNRMAVI